MGSSQSSKSLMLSPRRELEKLKLESGREGRGRVTRRQESRNGDGTKGKAINGGEWNVEKGNVVDVERGRKKAVSSGNGDGDNNTNVYKKNELREEELVNGWPKWLVENVPTDVLKNIVPKSADSYSKIDKLGQGTYSNVYKARDKETGKIVALKKVRFDTSEPESVKFMAREIMILQKLDHPNILKLSGLATSRMQYSIYLVFDCMHSDLSRILSRPNESLTEPQIKCYMQQLLSGLQHCHDRGILHRDIKGSNLLIDRNGMLMIADFGLASFFRPERRRPLTSRVVTLWYRAPELLLGSTDYGVGIDLWSVGCLMAEMYAGRPIMPARTEVEQLHRIFKLCGTPSDDYYTRLNVSRAGKPPQAYKSTLRETFRNFPSCSLDLLSILLSLDPQNRGSASSALENKFFETSPLACGVSGLPKFHIEEDERRKHRTTSKLRRRSQSHRDLRKKSADEEKADNEGSKEEAQTSTDLSVFSVERGSSSTSSSSTSTKATSDPFFTSSVVPNHDVSPRTEASSNVAKNIKNRPPIPTTKGRTTNYSAITADGINRLGVVQRSVSSREFGSLENKNKLKLHSVDY
ncbi:hypothetical protein ACS0TY_035799 [Phlomoides rotata]